MSWEWGNLEREVGVEKIYGKNYSGKIGAGKLEWKNWSWNIIIFGRVERCMYFWTYGKTFVLCLGHMERHYFGHMERHIS